MDSRKPYLEKAIASYLDHGINAEILLVHNAPNCGTGWQYAAERCSGDYIHFGADDVEMKPGWWQAALEKIDQGVIPAPRVLNPDGSLQSCGGESMNQEYEDGAQAAFTRGPFISRAWWEFVNPFPPLQYYTDNWVSWRGWLNGVDTRVCYGYTYVHHMAPGVRRYGGDSNEYLLYMKGEKVAPPISEGEYEIEVITS